VGQVVAHSGHVGPRDRRFAVEYAGSDAFTAPPISIRRIRTASSPVRRPSGGPMPRRHAAHSVAMTTHHSSQRCVRRNHRVGGHHVNRKHLATGLDKSTKRVQPGDCGRLRNLER
jgi:hypothetical protein